MKFPRVGLFFLIIIISVGSFLFSGCSVMRPVGDFFGRQYVNTVSYFNTFYNAKHLYDEALTELEDAQMRHQQQRRTGQFEVPQQTRNKFNNVIEKCSRLLHQYPGSRYADDAVLMIGQSYYHLRQNVQAERKFLELLAEFPESRNIPEAQLLLAKTQRRMNKHDEAQLALTNLIERLSDSRRHSDIIAQAHIELGDIEKRSGNYGNAVGEFRTAVEAARDRELRTEARFRLANTFFELERYDEAYDEYQAVIDDRPSNRILFESHRASVRILAKYEEYDKAIDLLEDLLTDLRLAEYIPRIELEAAHIYLEQDLFKQAIDQYVYVDTTHTGSPVATEAQYSLATIYKNTFGDYKKAKSYYEKVTRATPPSDLTRSAWQKDDQLTRYNRYKSEINRLDSVITAQKSQLHEMENRDNVIKTIDVAEVDSPADADSAVTMDTKADSVIISPADLQIQIVSKREDLIRNYSELAGLFYMEMERPDSAIYYYSLLAFTFPESPLAPLALYALGELVRVADENGIESAGIVNLFDSNFSSFEPHEQRDLLYTRLIEQYPDTEFATEAMRILGMELSLAEIDPLENVYLQAEKELAESNYVDALSIFKQIIQIDSESRYTLKARYAIGWLYENIFMESDSAIVYYQSIVEKHPDTQFASAVRDKVNIWNEQIAEKEKVETESGTEIAETPARAEEEPESEVVEEKIEDEQQVQRGIPIARPTDRRNVEEKPDTTRKTEQNEN